MFPSASALTKQRHSISTKKEYAYTNIKINKVPAVLVIEIFLEMFCYVIRSIPADRKIDAMLQYDNQVQARVIM